MNNNMMNMLLQLMAGGNNPQQLAQNLMKQNPQFNGVMQQVQNSGMTAKDFAMQLAKQNGVDINSMVDAMKKNGVKF